MSKMLSKVMEIQQHAPKNTALFPLLTSLITSVFRPIADMAITIKNLESFFRGENKDGFMPRLATNVLISDASMKKPIKEGSFLKKLLRLKTSALFLVSLADRYKESAKVIGIIAKVRVSLTTVAISSALLPVCIPSQALAVAVTEEVSLTAVPAKRPNSGVVNPNFIPKAGNIRAASTLNKNTTEIACAISSSFAFTTGAVAAMAEPPHMEEPIPTNMAVFGLILNILKTLKDTIRDMAMVETMMWSELMPTLIISEKLSPNPSRITAYCNIFFEVKEIPLSVRALPL